MLVLNVTYVAKKGMRERFVEQVEKQGILAKIRAEKGCVCYDYYIPREGEDRLFLVEKWESPELQAVHMQAPHLKDLMAIKEECIISTEVEKYNA